MALGAAGRRRASAVAGLRAGDRGGARKSRSQAGPADCWATCAFATPGTRRFEIRQLSAGKVLHDKFGWLPKSHVERYEKGQRYYQGRWMPAAEEAALRSDIKRGWRVESEHYVVTTNHSLEEGVALAGDWKCCTPSGSRCSPATWPARPSLPGGSRAARTRREPKQHNVVYFRTRDEYNDALRRRQPQDRHHAGHLFRRMPARPTFSPATSKSPARSITRPRTSCSRKRRPSRRKSAATTTSGSSKASPATWRSLAEHDGRTARWAALNAGPHARRAPSPAGRRFLRAAWPSSSQLGMESLQRDPRIAQLYSQSAGLADFFMHGRRGPLSRGAGPLPGGHLRRPRHDAHAGRNDRHELRSARPRSIARS